MRKRICILFLCLALMLPMLPLSGAAAEPALITDFNQFMAAVREASDGDVLLVGDIDFSPLSPDVPNSTMYITVDKSITVKSGKADGPACFLNGAFLLSGSKIAGEAICVTFENIHFDGKADYSRLTEQDFAYPWSDTDQAPTYHASLQAQQALSFKGNVDAAFIGCEFRNYMHEYGPVAHIRYADYTDNPYLSQTFADYSGCRLNLSFDTCRIEKNTALYGGGAFYLEGDHNVTLKAKNCVFSENRSGNGNHGLGGGAIWASGVTLDFSDCTLTKNTANHMFPDTSLPETDTTQGGALLLQDASLAMTNTLVAENSASVGGGLALTNVQAEIDGCRFLQNRADYRASNPYNSIGPKSNMGLGGAVYVEGNRNDTTLLINCEFRSNSAAMAYGGIYGFYVDFEDSSLPTYVLKMVLCTCTGNTADMTYDYSDEKTHLWWSHPGDLAANPHLSMFGCYITDGSYASDLPRNDFPTAENGYNYLAAAASEAAQALTIPPEAAAEHIGSRYNGKLTSIHVGSNYRESLYQQLPSPPPADTAAQNPPVLLFWIAAFCITAVLLFCGSALVLLLLLLILHRRRRRSPNLSQTAVEAPHVILSRYDDAQIRYIISSIPQTQQLTPRELEVLQEMLKGKKQSEVARYLGIEVSTVKDFYRKIYSKLNTENKEGIFALADQILRG